MSDEIIHKIYKSRVYLLEMMKENGYDVSKYEVFSIKEIEPMFNQLDMILEHTITKQKIYIKYMLSSINGSKIIETVQELYETPDVNNTIILNKTDVLYIITQSNINATLETELINLWFKDSIMVVIEKLDHLQFNIFKAKKVPKHILLSNEEREEILKRYTEKELPLIGRFDPVVRALCAKPGDIIKIIRPSPNSIESYYYRLCINVNSSNSK